MDEAEHHIVAVSRCRLPGCDRCGPSTPHNIVVKCACGETATGKTAHIWTITREVTVTTASEDQAHRLVTLTPSFDWENHLHEFVTDVPMLDHAELERAA